MDQIISSISALGGQFLRVCLLPADLYLPRIHMSGFQNVPLTSWRATRIKGNKLLSTRILNRVDSLQIWFFRCLSCISSFVCTILHFTLTVPYFLLFPYFPFCIYFLFSFLSIFLTSCLNSFLFLILYVSLITSCLFVPYFYSYFLSFYFVPFLVSSFLLTLYSSFQLSSFLVLLHSMRLLS